MMILRTNLVRKFGLLLPFLSATILNGIAQSSPQLRVLTYNIHHAEGRDGKIDYERIARIIVDAKPDIVALQEVDRNTSRANGVDQLARLEELTGYQGVFSCALRFGGGGYGNAILSKYPITASRDHALPYRFGQEPRSLLAAEIALPDPLPKIAFISTHFCHLSPETRNEQAKRTHQLYGGPRDIPAILAGDFNARPQSAPLSTLLDNGWELAGASEVDAIDHVFFRQGSGWVPVQCVAIDEPIASDHLPVLAVFEWRP